MSKNLIHPPSALCALYPGITIVTIADRANLIGRAKKILPRVSAGYLKTRPVRAGPLKSPGFRAKIWAEPRLDPALPASGPIAVCGPNTGPTPTVTLEVCLSAKS